MRSKRIQTILAGVLVFGVLGAALQGSALAQTPAKKAKTALVTIKTVKGLYEFSPETITVKHGQSVTWLNKTSNSQDVAGDNFKWKSKTIRPHKKGTVKFAKKGTFTYHDDFASYLGGTVKVK